MRAPLCFEMTPGKEILSPRQIKWLVGFLLAYFGLRLLFFAFSIDSYVPPDEVSHVEICRIYAKVFGFPINSPDTYKYGLVTNVPWLFYWLMGKLLVLNVVGISDLHFLRLLNIPFAFATVYFVWRLLRLVSNDQLTSLLLITALTNTLMFSFLSASVSYDNLTNLLAAMAIYNQIAFSRVRSGSFLGASWLCQLAGCLTKNSFLPLVLLLNIILFICEFKNLPKLSHALARYIQSAGHRELFIVMGILAGVGLNLQLYGGNYLNYGKLSPDMAEVLSVESAMQNRLEARYLIFKMFKDGEITYQEALAMASVIQHEGDREATISLLGNYLDRRYSGKPLMNPIKYMLPWSKAMLASVFGVHGHLTMLQYGPMQYPLATLIVLSVLAMLLRFRRQDANWTLISLMVIPIGYTLFLIHYVYYGSYQLYENFYVALQGRYIFPVIGPIYVLSCFYLLRLFDSESLKLMMATIAALIFISSDFPFFLLNVNPEWYASP